MKTLFFSFILTLPLLSPAAQTLPVQATTEEQQKARKELEGKALALLDEITADAQTLKLAENRVLVQSAAADLLWAHDEKRARAIFRDAMSGLAEAMSSARAKSSQHDNSLWTLTQLRQQALQMIARHDLQLALDLLRSTRQPANQNPASGYRTPDQELLIEQSIAAQVAVNDPKRALQMAEDSLAKGGYSRLPYILLRLQQKDGEAATRLAVDIVKKLETENLTTNHEAANVAQYLLRMLVQPPTGMFNAANSQDSRKPKPLVLDEQTVHELADIVATAALNSSPNDRSLMMVQPMLPELEKRVPERAAQLRSRFAEMNKTLDPESRRWAEFEPLLRTGTADAILEAAAKAPPEMRNALYSSATWKLLQAGDPERARQVIVDNLSGPERDQLLAQVDRQAISRAIEQGRFEEARQQALRIRSKERRAIEFAHLAAGVAAKGDRKLALQLLNEALGLINRPPENQAQITALLQIARAYAPIEPACTFEIIDPLVNQANEVLAAAALLEKFGSSPGRGLFRRGEMLLQSDFINTSGIYAQYLLGIAALARADFDRTKALANRFERNEVRIMARLLIAQGVLSDRPGPSSDLGEGYLTGNVSGVMIVN